MVGAQPQTAVGMAFDGAYAIVGEAVLCVEVLQYLSVEAIAVESVVGAHPDIAAIFASDSHGLGVVGTVGTEGLHPAVALDVEAAKAHGRGGVDAFAVGGDVHLRDVVVGDAVHLPVGICTFLHAIFFEDITFSVHADQAMFE